MNLKGKTAIVTGGGSGIGRTICHFLAREGVNVTVVDLNHEAANETASHITAVGAKALSLHLDVSAPDSAEQAISVTLEEFQSINILVNNAGIRRYAHLLEISENDWEEHYRINLKATYQWTKAAAAQMVKIKSGRIVNIASTLAEIVFPNSAAYATTKAAIRHFTRAAALDLAKFGITVNAVGPGLIKTPLTVDVFDHEDVLQERVSRIPLGRYGLPDDVAHAVLFFASDNSSFITGQFLIIDGGFTLL